MNESILKQDKVKFQIEKESLFIRGAVLFMAASAVLRLIGCWGLWTDPFFTTTQIVLPVCCNLIFIITLLFAGKKFFALSSIPVILGAVFFIIRATDFVWWKMLISIILYLATAFLYSATAFGIVRTKWPLVPVFGIPFIVHLVYDFSRLGDTVNPVTLSAGLQEISILCILLSLLCTALAMKKPKLNIEDADLPKIKGPKLVNPFKKKEEAATEDSREAVEEKPAAENTAAAAETNEIKSEDNIPVSEKDTKAGE